MNARGRLPILVIASLLALLAVSCGVKLESADGSGVGGGGGGGGGVTIVPPDGGGGASSKSKPKSPGAGTASNGTVTVPSSATPPPTPATTEPDSTTAPDTPGVDEEQIKDQLATGFKTLGLNDKEAKCLADAYIREFGVTTGTPDTSKIIDLFGECNIDPTKIGAGGGG